MEKNFDSNYISKLTKKISKSNLISYDDFSNYDLFLSQVIEFLNDKFVDENFTDNIIRNYIKNEVIARPEDGKKRGYTKTHLIQLVLLSYMRPLLTTEEIKKVFKLAFNEINNDKDDILSWEEAYKIFTQIQKESLNDYLAPSSIHEEKFEEIVKKFNLKDKGEDRIRIFVLVLSLISKASVIKKLVRKIVNEYETN